MNSYRLYLYVPLVVLMLSLQSVVSLVYADETASGKKWSPRFTFEVRPDRSRSLARFDALVPLWQKHNALFFSDVRYIDTSGTGMEGNLGMGYRQLRHDLPLFGVDWIWGGYAFFDRRKTSLENYFSQVTVGGELLTPDWSFRTNGYFPDKTGYVVGSTSTLGGGTTLSGTTVVSGAGGSTIIDKEWALPGFDVEAGYRFSTLPDHALWLYAGYFYFDRAETKEISGPRARLEYRIHDLFNWMGSEITLGAEVRDDAIGGTDGLVLARLSIPIGKTPEFPAQGFERRMTEFIQRDVDVVTLVETDKITGAGSPGPIVDPETGEILNVYVVNDNGTGDCTQANPCTLADVASDPNYGSGDVIVLVDNAGNIVGHIDLTTTVGSLGTDRRQVIGGEGDIVLNLSSGDHLSLFGLGGRPTLVGGVTLANQSLVMGFDIQSPGTAITGSGLDTATIRDINVVNAGLNGLSLQGVTGTVAVEGFNVQSAEGAGVLLDGFSGQLNFGDGMINNTHQAIVVQNSTGGLNFGDLSINTVAGPAIDLSSASGLVVLGNVDITQLGGGTGLSLNGSSANVTIHSLDVSGTGAPGSAGVDMRGATGSLIVANGGTIQNVVTGFNFDENSNATLGFQNGVINAGIPINTVGVSSGTYDFTGVSFIKDNTLSLETGFGNRFYFVDATGDGPGTPDNPDSADDVETLSGENDVIFLVEDGTGDIVATDGFKLQNNQQLIGFAAGDASVDFTGKNPRFIGSIVYQVADPTGNGAATLRNNGGLAALELASNVQVRDFNISTGLRADGILGENFSNANIHNVNVMGAGGHGIKLFNAGGTVNISDSRFIDAVGETFEIIAGDAEVNVVNSVISGSETDWLINIEDTTGGSVTFDAATTVSTLSGQGILLNNIGGNITFNGPVDIRATTGNGVATTDLHTSMVSFNDRLTIVTQAGSGLVISGGTLNIAGGSISATGGTGITASNTTVGIVLDSLSATAGTDGLNLNNVTGTVTILDR